MGKTYDSEQQKAINATGGHFLVLAPPGCGKTDILSERIMKAHDQGVAFSDMLCLTFTNRASHGMRERVRERAGEEASQIFVGNVHRFCSTFLFNHALVPENTSIIDEEDMTDILLSLDPQFFLGQRGLPNKNAIKMVDDIDAYISQRELCHPPSAIYLSDDYASYYDIVRGAHFDPEQVGPLQKILKYTLLYRQYKKKRHLISFSDILILAYDALLQDVDHLYSRYRWIQVDEVQDLNALQTAIIDQLLDTSKPYTVMYLGDEQQAIFSFLGAKMGQLNRLKEKCAGHVMTLDTNYRSPKYLLDIFNCYAERELHVDPSLLPQPKYDMAHDKFDLILTSNPSVEDEENRLCKMVTYYQRFAGERVAILVPTNLAADRISDKLSACGISHFKISGADLFRSKPFKTLSSFFCVAVNDFNGMAWARLLHGVGAVGTATQSRSLVATLKELMMTPSDLLRQQSYLAQFAQDYMKREFVFFDTETTGLSVQEDDIVQIAAFRVSRGERVAGSDFCIFLHTDKEIPAKLGEIDNPLIEAYARNPHYGREEGLQLFLDYIGDCPLLGHNVAYDYHILRYNVARTLHIDVTFETYDSLHLIKCVHPGLRMYKLVFLLEELHLEGKNSHLADEDIAATKALVDYCYHRSLDVIPRQQAFMTSTKVRRVMERLSSVQPFLDRLQERLHLPLEGRGSSFADELRYLHDDLVSNRIIDDLGRKFDIFLQFVRSEWMGADAAAETLCDQICRHVNDITSSINEGDLVNSEGLITDRVFIMTIHKGKGLEFDNVVVLEANDGTYPFFSVNKVLDAPQRHTKEEILKARQERQEDARKFYVALSRAKKRLCVSYTYRNSYGYETRLTPFMRSIKQYFYSGYERK